MFNRFQFNECSIQLIDGAFNTSIIPTSNFSLTDDIIFNSFGLQNSTYVTSDIIVSCPERELNIASTPSADGELFNSEYFRRKEITVIGRIFKTTQAALEAEIDLFKAAMAIENANLDISLVSSGTKRRYKATLQNPDSIFDSRKQSDITSAPYVLKFLAHEGLAEDLDFTNDSITMTSKTITTSLYNLGTFEMPVWWYFIFTTVNAITAVQIDNVTTGDSIKVTENITSADVLQIDGREKVVYLNGVEKNFDGFFPPLALGENVITITLTGTSATAVSVTAKYKKKYL